MHSISINTVIMTLPIIRANRRIIFMVNNNLVYTFYEVQIGTVTITNV